MKGKFCRLGAIGFIIVFVVPKPLSGADSLAEAQALLLKLAQDQKAGRSKDPAWFKQFQEETKSILPRVHSLVEQGILEELNRGEPRTAEGLQRKLRTALGSPSDPNPYSARVLTDIGPAGPLYIVAYGIGYWADRSLSSVNVYGPVKRKYELLGHAEDPLPNRTIALSPLLSTNHDEVRFLLYGINWGDHYNHLTAVAYGFDGYRLKPLLTRSDLVQGEVKVQGGEIWLTFLTIARGPGYPAAPVRTEIYRVTPSGISLQSTSEKTPS